MQPCGGRNILNLFPIREWNFPATHAINLLATLCIAKLVVSRSYHQETYHPSKCVHLIRLTHHHHHILLLHLHSSSILIQQSGTDNDDDHQAAKCWHNCCCACFYFHLQNFASSSLLKFTTACAFFLILFFYIVPAHGVGCSTNLICVSVKHKKIILVELLLLLWQLHWVL